MRPDIGFASYEAFQCSLPTETRERYWGLTNRLLAIKNDVLLEKAAIKLVHGQLGEKFDIRGARAASRKHRVEEVSVVMGELYEKAMGLNESIGVSSSRPDQREREVLALSVILARANMGGFVNEYFPGINIRVYKYTGEGYHTYSRNKIDIDIPGPEPEIAPATIPTNMAIMREHLKLATANDRVTSKTVGYGLLPQNRASIQEDTADNFVLQTAREILDVQQAKGKPKISQGEIDELSDTQTSLANEVIAFWYKGRMGQPNGLSDVSISLGYRKRPRSRLDQIVIRVSSSTLGNTLEVNTLAPWRLPDWSEDQKILVNMLRAAREQYDFILG